jgi:cell wall-associated NlpC family hydrolase
MELNKFVEKAIGVVFIDGGRGFDGWDCWGLLVKAYAEVYNIEVESFDGLTGLNSTESNRLFEENYKSWVEIKQEEEKSGDLIAFRGALVHIGVIIKPGLMLHTENKMGTCVEPYNSPVWKRRILGIFRHAELA